MTAQLSSAAAQASQSLCFVTHALLSELYTRVENCSQILYKLPEVYASLGREIKKYL